MSEKGRISILQSSVLTWIALLFVFIQSAPAQSAVTILNNGDPANRVDIAIIGDGYTALEMDKFAADTQNTINGFFAQEPFKEYQNYFNVHRVEVASAQSGADHPESIPPIYKDTAFDATYNCGGIQRLICATYSKVITALSTVLLPTERDIILVIVNDSQYGGSGGSVAVISTHSSVIELVLHEVAHTLGLLGDEYGGPPPPSCDLSIEPWQANLTMETNPLLIKWASWISQTTSIPTHTTYAGVPGLYQGAAYCDAGKYRPTYNSKMRSLYMPFEQVNMEQLVKRIYSWVSPLDASDPSSSDITIPRGRSQTFSVTTPSPTTHLLNVGWSVDGQDIGSGREYTLDSSTLTIGQHTVSAAVEDNTDMVRNDPVRVLHEFRSWSMSVIECSSPVVSAHPQSQTILSGQTANLSVIASGTVPLSYQWYRGSSGDISNPISGATLGGYTTPALTQTTSYWVRLSNSCGYADSNAAAITVSSDTQAPIISNVRATNITQTRVQVSWELDEYGTGQIEYGATAAYGSLSNLEPSFNYKSHSQTLSNLSPGTIYHFRVKSADASGNLAISQDYTFTTTTAQRRPRGGSKPISRRRLRSRRT